MTPQVFKYGEKMNKRIKKKKNTFSYYVCIVCGKSKRVKRKKRKTQYTSFSIQSMITNKNGRCYDESLVREAIKNFSLDPIEFVECDEEDEL